MRTTDPVPRTKDQGQRTRHAFTLIELLVVIGIIGLLVALLSAAVMRALSKGTETANRVEIGELDQALTIKFKQQYGVYPPSQLRLCESWAAYGGSQLETDSRNFLLQMFGSRIQATWQAPGIDWNGDGTRGNSAVTLYGDQCLVFFLGGIPIPGATPGCAGFSTNPADPSAAGGPRWLGYEFKSSRLRNLRGNGFCSYLDAYKQRPFAYFSSYNNPNGYNRYGVSDYPNLGVDVNVFPYAEAAGRYLNPSSFQILSAGRDGVFGQNLNSTILWNANTASSVPQNGKDDQANFSRGVLGAGP